MARWFWRRAAGLVMSGMALTAPTFASDPADTGYKPNDVIALKSPGQSEQKVTVIRSRRASDGRIHTEVKDSAGNTFTLIEEPSAAPSRSSGVFSAGLKDGANVTTGGARHDRSSTGESSPSSHLDKSASSWSFRQLFKSKEPGEGPSKDVSREVAEPSESKVAMADKRWRLFGRSDEAKSQPTPTAESEKKPGLLRRLFGEKERDKESPPSSSSTQPRPSYNPLPSSPLPSPIVEPPAYATPGVRLPGNPVTVQPSAPAPLPLVTNPGPVKMPSNPSPGSGLSHPGGIVPTPGPELAPWTPVRSPEPSPSSGVTSKPTPGVTTGTTRINLTPDLPVPAPTVHPVLTPPSTPNVPPVSMPAGSVPSPVPPPTSNSGIVPPAPSSPLPSIPRIPSGPEVSSGKPAVAVPASPALPPVTVPITPATPPANVPVPQPPQITIPPLPIPAPNTSSSRKPTTLAIQPVGYAQAQPGNVVEHVVMQDLRNELTLLKTSTTAADRQMAVKAIANSRYSWRPEVKALILDIAQTDPAPAVQLECIHSLTRLGCYDSPFIRFLERSRESPELEIRDAAITALSRMKVQD